MNIDWDKWIDLAKEVGTTLGLKLLTAIAIFTVGRWVARIVRSVVGKLMRKANVDDMLISFASSMAYMALMLFVAISAVDALGVDTSSLVAIIAMAGLAVGFALQGSLSNFAAGVMIIMFRPFKLGDFVEAGGAAGVITEIMIFNTVLKTGDNKKVIVPNGSMMGGNIVNSSAFDTRRVDIVAGIGYDDDMLKAKALFEKILADNPLVLSDPAPKVTLTALADSSVNFNVRPWCKRGDYWTLYSEVQEAIKLECDKAGISIPYPQQDVHMHTVGAA